jgi:hypothetical protein
MGERYRLSPANHVLDMVDIDDGMPRDLAPATSREAGEKIVRALNQLEGAVDALERLANPSHAPRSEEAYLLQGEVIKIAQDALDRPANSDDDEARESDDERLRRVAAEAVASLRRLADRMELGEATHSIYKQVRALEAALGGSRP